MLRRVTMPVLLAILALTSLSALLVLLGRWDTVTSRKLSAQVTLHPMPMPAGFELEPEKIAQALRESLEGQIENDPALSILVRSDNNKLLRERVLPRLVSIGAIRRLINDTDEFQKLITAGEFKSFSEIEIRSHARAPLHEVALLLPGAALVQSAVGAGDAPVREHEGDLLSLYIDQLNPGDTARYHVWFHASPEEIAARKQAVLLGAADGVRGEVRMFLPGTDWMGAGLQVAAWARWAVTAIVTFVFAAATVCLVLVLMRNDRGSGQTAADMRLPGTGKSPDVT